jgi:NADPH2:quinone reductase
MVVQIAKALGAKAIATAGSNEKVKLCRELGADLAINYKTEDVPARVRQFAPGGVDVWWETTREPNFEVAIPLLAPRGRFILMAGRDARPVFPVGPFYVKGCHLYGFAMFNATQEEQAAATRDINRWLAAGKIKARIDRVMPLDEAPTAHRLQEESTVGKSGALAGKIVIRP